MSSDRVVSSTFVYFAVCSQAVNHNNERERAESGTLRHAATECLPGGNPATYSYTLTPVKEI